VIVFAVVRFDNIINFSADSERERDIATAMWIRGGHSLSEIIGILQ
jgi:hypothetical protein